MTERETPATGYQRSPIDSDCSVPHAEGSPPPGASYGRRSYGLWVAGLIVAVAGGVASAHPLGNDTVSHFSVIYIRPDRIEVDLHLDFAEMPSDTLRRREIDANQDGEDTVEEAQAWLDRKAVEYVPDLRLSLDGRSLTLRPMGGEAPATSATASRPATPRPSPPKRTILKIAGVGGMPTYRLLIRYVVELPKLAASQRYTLEYLDAAYPKDRGLMRVLLEHPVGVTIEDRDCQYVDEPPDPFVYELYDPAKLPQIRTGRAVFSLAAASAAPAPERSESWQRFIDPRNSPARTDTYRQQAKRIEELFATGMSVPALALIALLCFGYGAAHALAPGHAKTIVAAYLISLRGTYRHAILLALIVTLTHTSLVIAVGLVFLKVSAPAGSRLQLWLGLSAGVIIACMGGWLMFRALSGRLRRHHAEIADHEYGHGHAHDHGHSHDHGHGHGHEHPHEAESQGPRGVGGWLRALFTHSHPDVPAPVHTHEHHSHEGADEAANRSAAPRLTTGLLLWLGISGGIVPCPAAIWMMLAGIAQGRPAAGLFAVIVFGLGLALTLMTIGFLALSSRRFAERLMGQEGSRRWLLTVLPTVGGAAVALLGGLFIAHYTCRLAFGQPLVSWLG